MLISLFEVFIPALSGSFFPGFLFKNFLERSRPVPGDSITHKEKPGAERSQKIAIMTNHETHTVKTVQPFLQQIPGVSIKMIGRFIERKKVGFPHESGRELRPLPLAVAQSIPAKRPIMTKSEHTEKTPRGVVALIEGLEKFVEQVSRRFRFLRTIDSVPHTGNAPALQVKTAANQPEQRRLARAVSTDYPGPPGIQ